MPTTSSDRMEYFALGEQLLVLRYEQFRDDPETVFFQLLDFVGAPRFVPADGFATRHNVKDDPNTATRKHPLTNATRTYLAALFRPYNELLANQLGEEWRGVWDS